MSDDEVTARERLIVRRTIQRVSLWVEGRKMDKGSGVLVSDAEAGFNLACDFLAHELRKIGQMENEEMLNL